MHFNSKHTDQNMFIPRLLLLHIILNNNAYSRIHRKMAVNIVAKYGIKSPHIFMAPAKRFVPSAKKSATKNKPDKSSALNNSVTKGKGAKANIEGQKFEAKTNIETFLKHKKFEQYPIGNGRGKHSYCLQSNFTANLQPKVIYLTQGGFQKYMHQTYGLYFPRKPDEAFLIFPTSSSLDDLTKKPTLKILEKKMQTVEGTVDLKLWCAPILKHEYEHFAKGIFQIEYAFCLSDFYKTKMLATDKHRANEKYRFIHAFLENNNIPVFFGEDAGYFDRAFSWIFPTASSETRTERLKRRNDKKG